jgi:hypothetical protein
MYFADDGSVNSRLSPTYLQIMMEQKHVSEILEHAEKIKALSLAKEMVTQQWQSEHKKRISAVLQLLPF